MQRLPVSTPTMRYLLRASGLTIAIIGLLGLVRLNLEAATTQSDSKYFEECKVRSDKGDVADIHALASCYMFGTGVDVDYSEAFRLYLKAAKLGFAPSQSMLGSMYFSGRGVDASRESAFAWWLEAAQQGDGYSITCVGDSYKWGWGVRRNPAESVLWFRKGAAMDIPSAQASLGDAYFFGIGVDKNPTAAVSWYLMAAQKDDASAQRSLGNCHLTGEGVAKDVEAGVKWLKKSASNGNEWAMLDLGRWSYSKGEALVMSPIYAKRDEFEGYGNALKFEMERHLKEANSNLLNEHGKASARADYLDKKARFNSLVAEMEKFAADNRDVLRDGVSGRSDAADFVEAFGWFEKASRRDNPEAMASLAWCYLRGNGVEMDMQEAVKLLKKAAQLGSTTALASLSFCYERGYGVAKDDVEAYAYCNLAGIESEASRKHLTVLEQAISPQARLMGQQRTKEIQKELNHGLQTPESQRILMEKERLRKGA